MTTQRSVTDPTATASTAAVGMSDEARPGAEVAKVRASIGDPRAGKADAPSVVESAREPLQPQARIRIYRRDVVNNRNNGRHGTIIARAGTDAPLWIVLLDGDTHTICVHQHQLQPLTDELADRRAVS